MHLRRLFLFALLLCLHPAFAADVPRAAYTGDMDQLVADGWVETSSGIYQRTVDGHQQTLAYGDAGPRLELGWLESQIALLTESFERSGSAEIALTLHELEMRRDALIEPTRLSTTRQSVDAVDLFSRDVSGLDQTSCTISHTVDATAGPGNSGPRAAATTSFSDSCGGEATIYCYAFSRAYSGTVYNDGTQADGPRTVNGSGSCSVSKEVPGDNNCFATSTSQVQFLDDLGNAVTFFDRESTNACAPMAVSIDTNDSTFHSLYQGQCVTLDFFASSNRSNPVYSWNLNNMEFGSGPTYSTTFCNYFNNTYAFNSVYTLEITGVAGNESDADGVLISIEYLGSINGSVD